MAPSFLKRLPSLGVLFSALLALSVKSAQDNHVFYIQPTNSSKCLTLGSNKATIRLDTECSSWDQQKWLFLEEKRQIVSVAHPDVCISVKYNTGLEAELCNENLLAQQIVSPVPPLDTAANPQDLKSMLGANAGGVNLISASGLSSIKSTTCIYPKTSDDARNANFEHSDKTVTEQFGFDTGDQVNWKCDHGYHTAMGHTEMVSECLSNGTWTLPAMNCVRIRCAPPTIWDKTQSQEQLNNTLSITSKRPADVYRLIDNNLHKLTNEDFDGLVISSTAKPVHFFFDDEIVYQCPTHFKFSDVRTTNPVSSLCSADGTWSIPHLNCIRDCDKTVTIRNGTSGCGKWTTPNFPDTYDAGSDCYLKLQAEDPNMKFKIRVEFMELEFRSFFSTGCDLVDKVEFRSYKQRVSDTDEFFSNQKRNYAFKKDDYENPLNPDAQELDFMCGNSEFGWFGKGVGIQNFQEPAESDDACLADDGCLHCPNNTFHPSHNRIPKTLTTHSNQFLIRFSSDRDTMKVGGGITWYTFSETMGAANDSLRQSPECKWNYNQNSTVLCDILLKGPAGSDEDTYFKDFRYGQWADNYHLLYVIIMIFCFVAATVTVLRRVYACITCKAAKVDGDSDYDSDEDSDLYEDSDSEYDMDEEEDDVDDFSLLTLLEMKANRVELGNAVNKLTREIDTLEEDAPGEVEQQQKQPQPLQAAPPNPASGAPPAGSLMTPMTAGGRRMSNVNKVHGK